MEFIYEYVYLFFLKVEGDFLNAWAVIEMIQLVNECFSFLTIAGAFVIKTLLFTQHLNNTNTSLVKMKFPKYILSKDVKLIPNTNWLGEKK